MARSYNPLPSLISLLPLVACPALAEQVFSGHTERVNSVAFFPDGSRVASGSHDHTVRQWRMTAGEPLCSIPLDGIVWCVTYSPDGSTLGTVSYDNYVRSLWNPDTCEHLPPPFSGTSDMSHSLAFSPDGIYLVGSSGLPESGVFLWKVASRAQIWHTTHGGNVFSVAYSPDGTKVLSGSSNGTARLWNASDGALICETPVHNGSVNSVAFSADGLTFWTACDDGIAREWNLGCSFVSELAGHVGAVQSVATSPNGAFIGTGGDDGTVRIWERSSGGLALTCYGHAGPVYSVAWSPSSTKIASGGQDATVRVWPVHDCNNNDIPDEYDVLPALFHHESGPLSPIGDGCPQSDPVPSPPQAVGDVSVTFYARADVSGSSEQIEAWLNDRYLGVIFSGTGVDCPDTPALAIVTIAPQDYNTVVNQGDTLITMLANGNVNCALCPNPGSWISVSVDYLAVPVSEDCNSNGVPDECEPSPACDVNCDGSINGFDVEWFVERLLADPPPACSPCAGDTNGDGSVNGFDIDGMVNALTSGGC